MVMSLLMFGAHKHPHNCLRKKSALKDLLLSKSTHKTSIIHRRVETKQVPSSEEYKQNKYHHQKSTNKTKQVSSSEEYK